MDYPMRPDLKVGGLFPDFELPDQDGEARKIIAALCGDFPESSYSAEATSARRTDASWPITFSICSPSFASITAISSRFRSMTG